MSTPERLATRTLALYGLPALGSMASLWLVQLYFLKYATDVLHVAPLVVGVLFAAGRVWDAIADPLAGTWSDRTRSALGRRRPWLLAAAAPALLAPVALWQPPEGRALVPWLAAALTLFYAGQAMFQIPHAALGPELAREGDARARLYASRGVFEGLGIAVAVAALYALENAGDPRAAARTVVPALGALAAVGLVTAGAGLRERPGGSAASAGSLVRGLLDVWRNPPAFRLLLVSILVDLGLGSLAAALPYASEYVLRTPGASATYMASYLGPMLLSLPLWVVAGRRIGRLRAWMLGNAACALGFVSLFALGEGDQAWLCALAGWIGVASGAGRVLAPTIQADVAEAEAVRSGASCEGLHFAVWTFGAKVGAALSLAVTGVLLHLGGFEPGAPIGSGGEQAIRIACAGLPAAALAASLALLAGFGSHARAAASRGTAGQAVAVLARE
jgi:GPH family glycoside/pentoside/hexuronide:cation symporter